LDAVPIAADRAGNGAGRGAIRRQQNDPRLQTGAMFGLRRTRQALKLGAFLRRQNNRRRFGNDLAAHAALNHDSAINDSGY